MERLSLRDWKLNKVYPGFLEIICEHEHHRPAFQRIGVEWDAFLIWVWNFGTPADTSLRTALQCASYILTGYYGYAPSVPHMEQTHHGGSEMVRTTPDRYGFVIKQDSFKLGMAMRNFRSHFNEEHIAKMVNLAMTSPPCLGKPPAVKLTPSEFPLKDHTDSLCQVMSAEFAIWAPLA